MEIQPSTRPTTTATVCLIMLLAVLGGCTGADRGTSSHPTSTFSGSPFSFSGPGVLVVVVWADWASTWKLLRPEVEGFQAAAPAGTQFLYLNADENRDLIPRLNVDIVPSVVLVDASGRIAAVYPNVISAQELGTAVRSRLAA